MRFRDVLLITVTVLAAGQTLPAWAESPSVPALPALDQAIEQYIRSHPEVIEQAIQSLEVKRQRGEKLRIRQAIATHQEELLRDPASPVSGNVNGDVTVIEFFDYRCGYCKRVASAVTQLQKDEPGVRVVYKDFPILGEVSVFGARAALAAREQGKHQAFHEAMLASEIELTKEEVLAIAKRVGLDVKKLEVDLNAPGWESAIDRNHTLANLLDISGTPGFVIGSEVYLGALELAGLKALQDAQNGIPARPQGVGRLRTTLGVIFSIPVRFPFPTMQDTFFVPSSTYQSSSPSQPASASLSPCRSPAGPDRPSSPDSCSSSPNTPRRAPGSRSSCP
ncbi:MAG: DsbA family protein [Nitrospira sp.]|nr:MAG: DsbA family protein [Nitrospira sp.]